MNVSTESERVADAGNPNSAVEALLLGDRDRMRGRESTVTKGSCCCKLGEIRGDLCNDGEFGDAGDLGERRGELTPVTMGGARLRL